jgi:hypothetical protein
MQITTHFKKSKREVLMEPRKPMEKASNINK